MKIGDEICWCPYGAGGKLPPHDVRGIPVETGSLPSFIIGTIETLGKTKNGQRPTAIRDDLGRVWDMTSGGDVFVRGSHPSADTAKDTEHAEAISEAITAAHAQLMSVDATDGHLAADHLARLLLRALGEEP